MNCRLVILFSSLLAATANAGNTDWPTYGNDAGSSKYAALEQINSGNVADLRVAWQWQSPDNALVKADPKKTPWGFKSTPLKIGNVLYISTSLGQVAAINATNGQTIWLFDTRTYDDGRPTNLGYNHRGVAHWSNGKDKSIIFMPTNNAYLWALDAKTGKPVDGFGDSGRVDLTLGLGRPVDRKLYSVISAPTVVADVVVVGSSILDGPENKTMPPGHVRAFDPLTGEQVWMFHTIPQGKEFGADTWEDESWRYTGNANVWTGMSADQNLGYIYLPTGTPTNDWYGGHRLGDNLFAESLVCVDARTGKRVWHFQMVHHGLWDYDLPAAPTLMDIEVAGKSIQAVAQVTKQGFVFVFDRVTGEPVWPIIETPVPQSSVPGEQASPTQPIPSKPAPFERQGMNEQQLIDFSPELFAEAKKIMAQFQTGPLYTPPSLQGTLNLPGWGGGANWTGAAFDPATQVLFVPSQARPIAVKLAKGNPDKTDFRYVRSRSVNSVRGPQGLPLIKPPYARVTAIDMGTGDHKWMTINGDGPRQKVIDMGLPDPGPLGASWSGGPVLTKSLLFVTQADGQRNVLRAFDKGNGQIVAEIDLPARPWGTPMTYSQNGKQYIVVASGQAQDARLVALALP
ncbi:MAG: pyrroloquinoline quinone-dependent dehydrogenase [Pseudomonadota bacterium]|nr:pyrroloquinoline quinone-dependent dehydrogenase [Pseudomonadota bacterium]